MRYLKVNDRLEFLRPMLDTWLDVVKRACESLPQISNFWYIEQSFVSFLSSAAWMQGIPNVVEAKVERHTSGGGPTANGRVDLLLYTPSGRVSLEAKVLWISQSQATSRISTFLAYASDQARTIPKQFCDLALAVVFVVPWPLQPGQGQMLCTAIDKAIDVLQPEIKGCQYKSYFPYPGAFLVGNRVRTV